jgi:hypothetical protein
MRNLLRILSPTAPEPPVDPAPDPLLARLEAIEHVQAHEAVERAAILEHLDGVIGHVNELCTAIAGLGAGVSAEMEALKAGADRLYQETRLLHNRAERIDGRMERAEIRMLSIDPHYPETQQQIPDDVLVETRQRLEIGLPRALAAPPAVEEGGV